MEQQYETFTIDQLVEDSAFCDWVISNENSEKWIDWVERQTPSRVQEIEKAKSLVTALSHNKDAGHMDALIKEKLWNRITETVAVEKVPRSKNKIFKMMAIVSAVAASLLLFVIFKPSTTTTIEVYAENDLNIELPKNSKINLVQNAKITYEEEGWNTERRVNLEGEAFFDVTQGRPFVVETNTGTVSVLGTSFTVLSEADRLYVDVATGRVEVASSVKTAVLQPGDRYWLNIEAKSIETYQVKGGHDFFAFKQRKVKDILPLIKKVYDVKINTDLVNSDAPVTTFFDSKDDLNQALENILFPLHLKFVVKGDQVVLM